VEGTQTENGQVQETEFYLLPAMVRQQLLQYLASRPYQEVVAGIRWLEQLEPAQEGKD
jgi:hypothetical protein